MKKTLLRLICLALAVLMVFSMAGCGNKATSSFDDDAGDFDLDFGTGDTISADNQTDDNTDTASDGQQGGTVNQSTTNVDTLTWNQLLAQMPKSLRGSTITICSWNPAKEVTGAESVISNFEKATGIKVNWKVASYDNYDSEIQKLVNAGNSPDLIRYYSPTPHRMAMCQDFKSATGYDFKGDIWDSRVIKNYTVGNKIYGVNLRNTFIQQPTVLMYKKSVVENAKLEDPYAIYKRGEWTWDNFIKMCDDYKKINPSGYAWMTYNGTDYLRFSGYSMIKFDGNTYTSNLTKNSVDVNVLKALTKMCEYRSLDYVCRAARDQKVFPQGNTLFMTFNSIAARKTNANLSEVKKEQDLYCVPIPTIEGRENIQDISELEAYGIPKKAKNPDAVYYFLRYYLDASNYDANNFFMNKQAYEVFQACMNKQEFFSFVDGELLDGAGKSGGNMEGITQFILDGGVASQLSKELMEVSGSFVTAAEKANEKLALLK